MHQHDKEVQEVEIKAQRSHDRFFGSGLSVLTLDIHALDILRVMRGQANKDQHTDNGWCEIEPPGEPPDSTPGKRPAPQELVEQSFAGDTKHHGD